MTTAVDIANRAILLLGMKKKITSLSQDSEEAQACATVIHSIRRQLLRMAPWDCALKTANLAYITSTPGTPENLSIPASGMWTPGLPTPPWNYEYQYPPDCLRACWILPSAVLGSTGVVGGTGGDFGADFGADFSGGATLSAPGTFGPTTTGIGPPVKFKIQTDTFIPVNSVTVTTPGDMYLVGDLIVLPQPVAQSVPIGAPAKLIVTGTTILGFPAPLTTVDVISNVIDTTVPQGGSYFPPGPGAFQAQGATNGTGTGAVFHLFYGPIGPQRVILTNQQFATMVYCRDVTEVNVMDDLFQDAWVKILGAYINLSLQGELRISNSLITTANASIVQARAIDGNEGLTISDITPDWIRIRGLGSPAPFSGPNLGFDWGGLWSPFG